MHLVAFISLLNSTASFSSPDGFRIRRLRSFLHAAWFGAPNYQSMAESTIPENQGENPSRDEAAASGEPVVSVAIVMHDDPFMRVMARLIYAEASRYDYR